MISIIPIEFMIQLYQKTYAHKIRRDLLLVEFNIRCPIVCALPSPNCPAHCPN